MTQIALSRLIGNEPTPQQHRPRPSLRRRSIERRIRALCIMLALTVALMLTVATLVFGAVGTSHAAPTSQAATIISDTNGERAKFGAAPVQHSDALASVAQAWAQHLADTNTFEHHDNGPLIPKGWSTWGENIAYNYDANPTAMHEMWVKSPGHHQNMINPAFNVMGVGWVKRADGRFYGVQVFAKYADLSAAGAEPVGAAPKAKQAPVQQKAAPQPAKKKAAEPKAAPTKVATQTAAPKKPSTSAPAAKKPSPRASSTAPRTATPPPSQTPTSAPSTTTPAPVAGDSGGGLPKTGGFGVGTLPMAMFGACGLGLLLIAGWALFGARSKSRPHGRH